MDPVIIIGAGHNGLTAAFYLAKAGLTPIVLERRAVVGGAAITEEIAAGYRCPALAHAIGPLRPAIVRDLQLERRGISFVRPDPRVVALSADGRALALSSDHGRAVEAIRTFSSSDADRYADFCATLERLGAFFAALADHTPPSLNPSSASEMWALLKTGRRFRALGRADSFRLLRWAPMAVADFVGEWFETEPLQAVIASRGVFGTALGPRSAGTGAVLLTQAGVDAAPGGGSVMVTGGPGSLTSAMADAARDAGAEVQTGTTVARILARDGRVTGVVLGDGREIQARAVISNADPRSTLLNLVDPLELDPGFLTKARNVRCPGTVAKVNLALAGAPAFTGVDAASVRGRVHIGPSIDYLERAFDASKYGQLPEEPYLDITIPTLHDPTLAPPGHHVMSIVAQFVPYKLADGQQWDTERDRLAAIVIRTLDRYAPGIARLVQATQVLTPLDLEREYSFSGGHIFHGELSLGQLFTMRPILGWAQYRTPLAGLYLCGAGTHGAPGITGTQGRNAAREVVRDFKRGGPSGSTVR